MKRLLNIVNYQTLVATKAARIRSVIEDEPLMDGHVMQEMDAALVAPMEPATLVFLTFCPGDHAHALQAYRTLYCIRQTHKNCVFLRFNYDTFALKILLLPGGA